MRKAIIVIIIFLFTAGALSFLSSQGNIKTEPKKIGVLVASDLRIAKVDGLRSGLNHYGLGEGKDYGIIIKNAQGQLGSLRNLAKELVNEKVDVIITTGTFETFAAKEVVANRIPIVFVGVGCAVEMGIVNDVVNPGCNVTGIDSHYVQLSGKRLEYLKRLAPDVKKVLVLYNPHSTPIGPSAVYLYEAAAKLNVELTVVPVESKDEAMHALASAHETDHDAVMLMCSLLFEAMTEQLAGWSIKEKVPVIGVSEQQTEKGLLASYGLPYKEEGRQAARIVGHILRSQNLANIPIESPARLEFHLNVNTARELGIKVDPANLPFVTKYVGSPTGGI